MPTVPALNIQYPDMGNALLSAAKIKDMQQQNAIRDIALRRDEAVRNALSGVQNMEDVRNAIPSIMREDPKTAISLFDTMEKNDLNRLYRNYQIENLRGKSNDPSKQKAALENAIKTVDLISAHNDPLSAYGQIYGNLPPGMFRAPNSFRNNDEFRDYAQGVKRNLASMRDQLFANTPHMFNQPGQDEEGNPTVTPTAIMPGQGPTAGTPIGPTVRKNAPTKQPNVTIFNQKEGRSITTTRQDANRYLLNDPNWKEGKPLAEHDISDAAVQKSIGEMTGFDPQESARQWDEYLKSKESGLSRNQAWNKVQQGYSTRQVELEEINKALNGKPAGPYDIKVDGVLKRIKWDGTKIVP